MNIVYRIVGLLVGYLFGLFNTGKIISKRTGHDLNKEGSGNSGATNAFRVLGWKVGLMTFLGDSLKAIIPIIIFKVFFINNDELGFIAPLYAGLGSVLGHIYPIYNKFKGGKGVSSTCGFVIATKPILAIIPLFTFIILAVFTGYVSLSSITAFSIVIIQGIIYGLKKYIDSGNFVYIEFIIIYSIIPAIGIYKHKENIKRLINGTENRFGHRK